jgi:hypothetical protein
MSKVELVLGAVRAVHAITARIFRHDPCSETNRHRHDSIDSLNTLLYNHEVVAGKTGAGGR